MPAAKNPVEPVEPTTLEKIAAIVRHPEAAEHGGRNRYKREAIEQIKVLTADVKLLDDPVVEAEEIPAAPEVTIPDDDPPEAA